MQVYEYLVYKMKIANIQDEPHDQDWANHIFIFLIFQKKKNHEQVLPC